MPNRKRRILGKPSDQAYVSREEFEQLRQNFDNLLRSVSRGSYIRPVVGGGAAGDDGYEVVFPGVAERADLAETVETITDGSAPASSPTPTVRGALGALVISWDAVANADPVTYEVHISDTTGFTPDSTTLAAEMRGTDLWIRAMPDGTPLDYFEADGTTEKPYYVRVIAKDDDGSAAAGVEGSGSMDQTGEADILAGSVTAEKLESILALVSKLIAGIEGAERIEFGLMDDDTVALRAWGSDGAGGYVKTFEIDSSGQVLVRGQVYFGDGSRLMPNDVIELQAQQTSFYTPLVFQWQAYSNPSPGNGSLWQIEWDQETTDGSTLFLQVVIEAVTGTDNPRTIVDDSDLTAAGWVQMYHETRGDLRMYVYKLENAAPQTVTPTFELGSGSAIRMHHRGFEFLQTSVQDVAVVVAEGGTSGAFPNIGATLSVGPTATPDPTKNEVALVFEAFGAEVDVISNPSGYAGHSTNTAHDHVAGTLGLYSAMYRRNFTAPVAAQSASHDLSHSFTAQVDWLMMIVTFEAQPVTAVATPGDGKVRLYAKENAGVTGLHVMDEVDRESSLALTPADERWRFSYYSAAHDPASVGAHSTATHTFTNVPDLAVGDLIIFLDKVNRNRGWIIRAEPVCTVAGQFDIGLFNADTAAADPGADTYHFLIIHRS